MCCLLCQALLCIPSLFLTIKSGQESVHLYTQRKILGNVSKTNQLVSGTSRIKFRSVSLKKLSHVHLIAYLHKTQIHSILHMQTRLKIIYIHQSQAYMMLYPLVCTTFGMHLYCFFFFLSYKETEGNELYYNVKTTRSFKKDLKLDIRLFSSILFWQMILVNTGNAIFYKTLENFL